MICMGNNFQGSTSFAPPREPETLCCVRNCRQRWPLSMCPCHIIFLCLRSHRGGLQGLLLTCNNSRGYGFPPLPNLAPGSWLLPWKQNIPNRTSNLLGWLLGEHGNVCQRKERKETLERWLWPESPLGSWWPFVSLLNFSLLLIYIAECDCK